MLMVVGCSRNGTPVSPDIAVHRLLSGEGGGGFSSDPRFKGYTESEYATEWTFYSDGVPKWAEPCFLDPKFDGFLTCILFDPHQELDTLSLTLALDGSLDLSNDLIYTAEKLPDNSLLFHIQCPVPKEYQDGQYHMLDGKVESTSSEPCAMSTRLQINPLLAPGINFAVYPYREIWLPVEEQKDDPGKMLVLLDGEIRPEWESPLSALSAWTVGSSAPESVEVFPKLSAALLHLKEPIAHDPEKGPLTVRLGPVEIEEGLWADDSTEVGVDPDAEPGELDQAPCWCDFQVEQDHHDYIEGENFGWAYQAYDLPDWCPVPGPNVYISRVLDVIHTDWRNYSENEDHAAFDTEWKNGDVFRTPYSNHWLTKCPYGAQAHYYYMYWGPVFQQWGCAPRSVTLTDTFLNVDLVNPYFVEPPRLGYGPEVGEWLQEYWEQSQIPGSGVHWGGLMQPLSYYQENLCTVYLMVHSSDAVALALADNYTVQLDIRRGDEWSEHYLMPTIGEGIWVDSNPPYDQEWEQWSDPDFNNGRFPEDNHWQMEEYLCVTDMTSLLADPTVDEVRVRISDHRHNWRRSGNVIEFCQQCEGKTEGEAQGGKLEAGNYKIIDLMFRGERYEYEDDDCWGAGNMPDRRVGCDGPLGMRIQGEKVLDVCALVQPLACQPHPTCVAVELSGSTDEPNYESISISLYELSPMDSHWENIWADFACDEENSDIDPECMFVYCRGSDRNFENIGDNHPPMAKVRDNGESVAPPPDEFEDPPFLYVSSGDDRIAPPGSDDFKDYSVAIGNTDPGDPLIWSSREPMTQVHYGQGNRGTFEPEPGGCVEGQDFHDNVRPNVPAFGAEWVKAVCGDEDAYFPVQSEADIMFAHAHGRICGYNDDGQCGGERTGESYMAWFPPKPDSYYYCQFPQDVLFAGDWNDGALSADADWLAATCCWLLADYTTTGDTCEPWEDWQALVWGSRLKSVLGFRALHGFVNAPNWTGNGPPPDPETYFWLRFCELLEIESYEGDPNRWYGHVPAQEYACRCYMEAAWEYSMGLLGDTEAYSQHPEYWPSPDKYHELLEKSVAAVDVSRRYVLKHIDPPNGNGDLMIVTL